MTVCETSGDTTVVLLMRGRGSMPGVELRSCGAAELQRLVRAAGLLMSRD